jgi:hypothetical protein
VSKEKPPGVLPGRAGGQCKGITTMHHPSNRRRSRKHFSELLGPDARDRVLARVLREHAETRPVALRLLRPHIAIILANIGKGGGR